MSETYNPKVDYLICKYLYDFDIKIEDEQLWKDIYNQKTSPKTRSQEIMLRAKKTLMFIKRHSTKFTLGSIKKCLEIISDRKYELSDSSIRVLKEIIKMFKTNSISNLSEVSLILILQRNVFPGEWNVEMSKIVHNFIQIKNGLAPTIFYHHQTNRLKKLIDENEIEGAMLEIKNSYERTRHFNTRHELVSLQTIINKIIQVKETLKEKYGVEEIYMYGSYAKGTENEYSDLDLFIKVNSQKKQDINNKYLLFDYLEKELGLFVDGIVNDISFHHDSLKEDMKKHLTRII